jgi:hypothetical protein
MVVAPSALKRSVLAVLQRVPKDEVFHPGHDFAGSFTTIIEDRFRSLDAQKIPPYDEGVIKSFEKGIKLISEDRWKKQVSPPSPPSSVDRAHTCLSLGGSPVPHVPFDPDSRLKSDPQLPPS